MSYFQSGIKRSTLIVLLLVLLAAQGFAVGVYGALKVFGPGPSRTPHEIVVERGNSIEDIAHQLEDQGIIRRWWTWALMARLGVDPSHIKAGEYLVPPGASAWAVLDIIRRGDVIIRKLTVPEGMTSHEIVNLLQSNTLLRGAIDAVPPEGSLLPETYYFQRGDERRVVIRRMQDAMKKTLAELWPQRAGDIPLTTPEQVVTLASIVEKETGHPEERPRVAGVFYNRIAKGMALQSDPTTIYALTGGKGSIQAILGRQLRRSDWQLKHPYNTYAVRGLPPGPIANPGRASLKAVLNPEKNNYIFFVADAKGGHTFSATYDAHKKNISARQHELKQIAIAKEKAAKEAEREAKLAAKAAEKAAKEAAKKAATPAPVAMPVTPAVSAPAATSPAVTPAVPAPALTPTLTPAPAVTPIPAKAN